MIIVVDSLTGQGQRFAQKLGYPVVDVNLGIEDKLQPLFLVTRSFNFGQVPEPTLDFLDRYHKRVVAVVVSGNRNWGENYGKAGERIRDRYGIPLLLKFEGSGFKNDIQLVQDWIQKYEEEKEV